MPLHLLGKKSWNVYNKDNIDRVRRDEAAAQAAEKEAEREKRDDEASERLRILRGGQPEEDETELSARPGKKRKRGEDDDGPSHGERRLKHSSRNAGHRDESRDAQGNLLEANVTHEKLDSISNMRFRDALGRHNGAQNPWYSTTTLADPGSSIGRDVWGNEDAGRQVRDQKRLDASDPLLAIKRGVKQLKDVEKQKSEWRKERERDLYEVEDLARRERHRRRREERHKHDKDKDRNRDRDGEKHRLRRDGDDRKRTHSRDITRPREKHP